MKIPDKLSARVRVEQLTTTAQLGFFIVIIRSAVLAFMGSRPAHGLHHDWYRLGIPVLLTTDILILLTYKAWIDTPDKLGRYRRYHAWICGWQVVVGLVWAIGLFDLNLVDPARGKLLFSFAIGILTTAALSGPISVAFALWIPVAIGTLACLAMIGGLAQTDNIVYLAASMAISGFAIVYLNIWQARHMIAAIRVEESDEVIRILLKDFMEHSSDWLWETDAALTLQHISPRFAEVARRPESELGISLMRLIGTDMCAWGQTTWPAPSPVLSLADTLNQRLAFRDLVVPLLIEDERRYWALSGKPVFDHRSNFLGYRGVGSDVTDAHIAREHVAYLARYDSLTNLANRVAFNEALERGFGRDIAPPLALLYVDLDDFKNVNDTHGHAVGDALLAAFAGRLRNTLRDTDTGARLGGDEFAILMRDADVASAHLLARQLIETVAPAFALADTTIEVGISVGIAVAPQDGETPDQLCKAADLALYCAKSVGSGVHFYDRSIDIQVQTERALQADLKRAIGGEELSLAFQPIVELATQRIVVVEALLRWTHPRFGPQAPASFIPAAEQSGLIVPLGAWVIREACRVAARLPPAIVVAINLSPVQLREEDLVGIVDAALAAHGLPASRLEFEITETAALEINAQTTANLIRLRDRGCGIALDDFGVGYSSLGSLLGCPFDKVKIDRSFIAHLGANDHTTAIFNTIMYLGRQMDITIVAEGVETTAQAERVRLNGCTLAQGNLFARPLDEPAILALTAGTPGAPPQITQFSLER